MHQPYQGDGRRNQPYHPTMLVKVLVYAYATGVFFVAQNRQQAHRRRCTASACGGQSARLSHHQSLSSAALGNLRRAVRRDRAAGPKDGFGETGGRWRWTARKIKANASKHKAMSYQRIKEEEQRLEKEIQQLIEKAQQTDAAEDELYGPDKSGDELPPRNCSGASSGSKRSAKPSRRWNRNRPKKTSSKGAIPATAKWRRGKDHKAAVRNSNGSSASRSPKRNAISRIPRAAS